MNIRWDFCIFTTACAPDWAERAMTADPYSRLIAFLKVALPLVALAILSTIFLVSSRMQPGETIPFAEGEIAERIRTQQVTRPLFSGVTSSGDRIGFSAEEIVTTEDRVNTAVSPVAQLDIATGSMIRLEAERGQVDLEADVATMMGEVVIESSNGFSVRSERIMSHLSFLEVRSPAEVTANGPAGTLTAGSMLIGDQTGSGRVELLFKDGVKLVYDPKDAR